MLLFIFIFVFAVVFSLAYFHQKDRYGYLFVICCISITILVFLSFFAIKEHIDVDAYVRSMQQRYSILSYQMENNVYNNDNDLGKRELFEQVRKWNEDLAKNQVLQNSIWVGMFYPNIYDQFSFISY